MRCYQLPLCRRRLSVFFFSFFTPYVSLLLLSLMLPTTTSAVFSPLSHFSHVTPVSISFFLSLSFELC